MRLRSRGLAALVGVLSVLMFLPTVPAAAQEEIFGIDASHWQDDRAEINWQKVVESGQAFVFYKATEGATYTDPTYAENRAEAGEVSLPFGAYHFARPQGGTIAAAQADAGDEARHFLAVAQPAGGDLVPVLDMEATGGLPPRRLIAWTQAWLDAVSAALEVKPLIYTSPNFWKSNLNDTTKFAAQGFPLWLAHYTSAAAPSVPASNWNGAGWAFWQYTSEGRVPGIQGNVDLNRFSGSDLSPYTIPGAPEPIPSPDPATPPVNQTPPTISGETEVGEVLTASNGTWAGSEPFAYSYAWYRCDGTGVNCTSIGSDATGRTYTLGPADLGYRMKVTVTATNSAGSSQADSAPSDTVVDTTPPPPPSMIEPSWLLSFDRELEVSWREPEASVASYDVRYRAAAKNGRFGDQQELVSGTTERSTTLSGDSGRSYCFSVRARDEAGNVSRWSKQSCTYVPLDERDLVESARWREVADGAAFEGTLLKTRRRGQSLRIRNIAVQDLHLIAQRCPGCGKVAIYLNGDRIARVGLGARRVKDRQLIRAASFGSIRRGNVRIEVISRGAPVKLDGLSLAVID